MLLNLKKTPSGLIPVGDESVKAFNKIKVDNDIFTEWKPRRNMKFHKKYFALLNAVIHNQEHYKTVNNLHESIKFKSGYFETIIPLNGQPFLITKSIAFHSMDAEAFENFYSVALDECLLLVGDDALSEIIKFI